MMLSTIRRVVIALGFGPQKMQQDIPHIFTGDRWTPRSYSTTAFPATPLHFTTWNIDFCRPFPDLRLRAILDRLPVPTGPSILLLQELDDTALPVLLSHPLIRAHFTVITNTPGSYTTATLLSHSIPVCAVQRVEYPDSCMSRDCLAVDIPVPGGVLRIANTHLESLPNFSKQRAAQMEIMGDVCKEEGVVAAVCGGDMNAIRESDEGLPGRCGLGDVWEMQQEERGEERETEVGMTWGYQPRCKFPVGRLDKVLYRGKVKFLKDEEGRYIKTVGAGWKYEIGEGETWDSEWVSDHYGLEVDFCVE